MTIGRLTNIDAMRGISALLVVWQHGSETFNQLPEIAVNSKQLSDMVWAVDFGRIGVVCFFLISGFVVPFSLSTGESALKKFLIRRFFRLYPAYWLSIACTLLVTYFMFGKTYSTATVLANITMFQRFLGEPHIQGLYWTLQAEIIFYGLCCLLFVIGVLNKPSYQLTVCIVLLLLFCIISFCSKNTQYFNNIHNGLIDTPYVLSIMFSGTIFRTILTTIQINRQKIFLLLGPITVFIVPILIPPLHSAGIRIVDHPLRFCLGHLLGLGLFLASFNYLKKDCRFFLWLGSISYSIYLFHTITIQLILWLVTQELPSTFKSLHMGLHMIIVSGITIIIASTAYHLVEKPSITLGRFLTKPC